MFSGLSIKINSGSNPDISAIASLRLTPAIDVYPPDNFAYAFSINDTQISLHISVLEKQGNGTVESKERVGTLVSTRMLYLRKKSD
jgi:hypothetical protein